jgi:hypothetical protein
VARAAIVLAVAMERTGHVQFDGPPLRRIVTTGDLYGKAPVRLGKKLKSTTKRYRRPARTGASLETDDLLGGNETLTFWTRAMGLLALIAEDEEWIEGWRAPQIIRAAIWTEMADAVSMTGRRTVAALSYRHSLARKLQIAGGKRCAWCAEPATKRVYGRYWCEKHEACPLRSAHKSKSKRRSKGAETGAAWLREHDRVARLRKAKALKTIAAKAKPRKKVI